jgi:UDP-GlcNAc:undecaprenyl-phosphate GlcNAc-1-phosphate transferase
MSSIILLYFYAFVFTFVISLFFTSFFRKYALIHKIIAHPHKERLHEKPIPLLGGVAIVFSFYLFIIINFLFLKYVKILHEYLPDQLIPYIEGALTKFPHLSVILICGFLIFLLGLIDDLKVLGPKRKFLFQIFIGCVLYFNDIRITLFFGDGFLSLFLTVLWVVAVTNAFNLLDNIDGLSSGIAIISAIFLFILCLEGKQILVSLLLIIFIGAVGGFLRFNYHPAKIFMGDAGSLFIGYIIAVITMMSTFYYQPEPSIVPFVSPLLILAVPFYDTFSVICIRIKNGKSIFSGDKNHFSHRLLRLGMSQKQTVLFIYLVSLCLGIAALVLKSSDVRGQVILLFQALGLLAIIYLLERLQHKEVEEK